MTGAFSWIGELAQWVAKFFPRLVIIRSTHRGVRFRNGKSPGKMLPGLRVYWPLVTETVIQPVARQTLNLPTQSLTTLDRHTVGCSGVVVYSITDILKAVARTWDVDDTISDVSMLALTTIVSKHAFDDVLTHLTGHFQDALTDETRRKLRRYGVSVHIAGLTDFANCQVIRTMSDGTPLEIIPANTEED